MIASRRDATAPWVIRALARDLPAASYDARRPIAQVRNDIMAAARPRVTYSEDEDWRYASSRDQSTERARVTVACPCQADPFPADWDGDNGPCVRCGKTAARPRVFHSPYTVDVPFANGTPVHVIRAIRHPDAAHDPEVLPMYEIETDDGRRAEAYREELRPLTVALDETAETAEFLARVTGHLPVADPEAPGRCLCGASRYASCHLDAYGRSLASEELPFDGRFDSNGELI